MQVMVAGNTTMTHLFLGITPRYVREQPYIPAVNHYPHVVGADLGLMVLLGFSPGAAAVPALAVILLVTVASCTCFGMLLGSIGLRAKDFFFAANLATLNPIDIAVASTDSVAVFCILLRKPADSVSLSPTDWALAIVGTVAASTTWFP
jgi:hypothetical protein